MNILTEAVDMTRSTLALVAAFVICVCGAGSAHAQFLNVFEGAPNVPTDWNVDANWGAADIPDNSLDDAAVVTDNQFAFISAAPPTSPAEVRLATAGSTSNTTLEIRSGGSLSVLPGNMLGFLGDGGIEVGGPSSSATLSVLPTSSLNVAGELLVSNALNNKVIVGSNGGGTATVSVGSATLRGLTQVFANASINSNDGLTIGSGTYQMEIRSGQIGVVNAVGDADVTGTLHADFAGFTPTTGQTWKVLEASNVIGNFTNITTGTALGAGQKLISKVLPAAGGREQIQLSLDNVLTLNVNRDSGEISINNTHGSGISFDGYSIRSATGFLNSTGWSSLDEQNALGGDWRESNVSANQLAELKPTGVGTAGSNSSLPLGMAFSPFVSTFGMPEDITFDYTQTDGAVIQGIVRYTGTSVNNLVLQVDPVTGQTRVRNTSQTTVMIDGYDVASASGSLSTTGWDSLDDQNAAGGDWRESNASATHLAELKAASSTTLAPGADLPLGALFVPAGTQDLVFSFLQAGNSMATSAAIAYESISAGLPGDFNNNGAVENADLTLLLNNWASPVPPVPTGWTGTPQPTGPAVDNDELTALLNNWGATVGGGATSGLSVPEPGTWAVIFGAALCLAARRQCQRREPHAGWK